MRFDRVFTEAGVDPFASFTFVRRSSKITDHKTGATIFVTDNVLAPEGWSQTAVDILAQKYFRKAGVPDAIMTVPEEGVPAWLWRRVPREDATFGGEYDARQTFLRMVGHWTYWGWKEGYFSSEEDARAFHDELCYMLAAQMAAPASPQWFGTGLWWAYGIEGDPAGLWAFRKGATGEIEAFECPNAYERPLAFACYILPIEDNLVGKDGITDFMQREARVFKFGGGVGGNYSRLRGAGEPLSGGGVSSGLLSFLKPIDSSAGAIKSAGTVRRAARMVVLDADHPDIETFISWKTEEEKKAAELVMGSRLLARHMSALVKAYKIVDPKAIKKAEAEARSDEVPEAYIQRAADLAGQGFDNFPVEVFTTDYEGGAYTTITGQNANNSVSVTKAFMDAVEIGGPWHLYGRTELEKARREGREPAPCKTLPARDLWDRISREAWACADPGLQFNTTMNDWHTTPESGRIEASNPCQPGFATVLTPEGVRTFDDIDVGSTIWSGTRWTTVTRKVATGVKEVFRYRTTAGVFYGTPDHRVVTPVGKVRVEEAETIRMAVGPVPEAPDHYDRQLVVDGWVLGDGMVHKASNNLVLLCLGAKDGIFHEILKDKVLCDRSKLNRYAWEVQTDVTAAELLCVWERRIPTRYMHGTAEEVCSFLRGLYAANGSVCGGRVTLKTFSPGLAEDVQTMLSSIGIPSYTTTNKEHWVEFDNGEYVCRKSCDVNITRGRQLFATLIGFVHTDKAERLKKACSVSKAKHKDKSDYEIRGRENVGTMPVYDITVDDPAHTYWTGGHLVSNCSEFMYINNSCCNLASINYLRFTETEDNRLRVNAKTLAHASRVWTVVLDITAGLGGCPSREVALTNGNHRTLGLGFSNLGAVLMRMSLPYDSPEGRAVAAALTCLLHCTAYKTSAEMAAELGAFPEHGRNKTHVLRVVHNHAAAAGVGTYHDLSVEPPAGLLVDVPDWLRDLKDAAVCAAGEMVTAVSDHGVRNGQVTLAQPNGTVGLLMDCDTTGVEPDFALVKWKKLAGGGHFTIINQSVEPALKALGYTDVQTSEIMTHILGRRVVDGGCPHGLAEKLGRYTGDYELAGLLASAIDVRHALGEDAGNLGLTEDQWADINRYVCGAMTTEGAPHLREEHLAVFDCANKCGRGGRRFIRPEAHLEMLSSIQPFLSGAISKCVTGDTLVTTDEGLVRIGSLYRGETVDSFRNEARSIASVTAPARTDAFYYGGQKPTIEVRLRSGHRVVGTDRHRLLTMSDGKLTWTRLGEVKTGDHIAVRYGARMWSKSCPSLADFQPSESYGNQTSVKIPGIVDDELSWFLGVYAADGHTSLSNWTVVITKGDVNLLTKVKAAAARLFNLEGRITQQEGKCPGIVFNSKTLVELLMHLQCGKKAVEKRIPDIVMRSPESIVLRFLSGLYWDGFLSENKGALRVGLCMASNGLLDDLQVVLTNLGCIHSRVSKWNEDYQRYYDEINIYGREAVEFACCIDWDEPHKHELAKSWSLRAPGQSTTDIIPGLSGRDLYYCMPRGKKGRPTARRKFTILLDHRTKNVSWETLKKVSEVDGVDLSDDLKTVLAGNIHFSPVTEVADGGIREVFDLSVPETQAFVGNGIVNHNTCNIPSTATVEDVSRIYKLAYHLGLKAVALYRDGSKLSQPLTSGGQSETVAADSDEAPEAKAVPLPVSRRTLPARRYGYTQKARINGQSVFLRTGEYEDGQLGEIFLNLSKQGTGLCSMANAFAVAVSLGLQHGVPLEEFVHAFLNTKFDPAGIVQGHDAIKTASSIIDLVFRDLAITYLGWDELKHVARPSVRPMPASRTAPATALLTAPDTGAPQNGQIKEARAMGYQGDACTSCGQFTLVRSGACLRCDTCGNTSGCGG